MKVRGAPPGCHDPRISVASLERTAMPGLLPHFWGITFAIAPPSWSKRQSRLHLGPKGNRADILAQKAIAPPSWPERQSRRQLSPKCKWGQKPWRCRDPRISVASPHLPGIATMPGLLPSICFWARMANGVLAALIRGSRQSQGFCPICLLG